MSDDATASTRRTVESFIRQHGLLGSACPVHVGFSGGADSTALLLILHGLVGDDLTAIHLQHGLRGDAAERDAQWCRDFCTARRIRFRRADLDVPSQQRPAESIEMAARRCRLQFWERNVGPHGVVALGHHLDDCLEDLLLRLARGAGVSGLTGLRPQRTIRGVRLVRPLLCLRRAEIEDFLRAGDVNGWCRDTSNADTRLRRNAARHEWLPAIRRTVGHDLGLLHSLEALRQDADLLEAMAGDALGRAADVAAMRALHPALLPRVLRLWLAQELGRDLVPRHEAVQRLREELTRPDTGPRDVPLGEGIDLTISAGRLAVKQTGPGAYSRRWAWRRDPVLEIPAAGATLTARLRPSGGREPVRRHPSDCELFAESALPDILTVRGWEPGDRMVPFGRTTAKKLQDVFTNAGIRGAQRGETPVVAAGEQIIWVAGLRRAEFGRVESASPGSAVELAVTRRPSPAPDGTAADTPA